MAVKEEKENVKTEKKKSGALVIIIAAIGALIVGGLIMGLVVYNFGIPGTGVPKGKEAKKVELETLELGERVVNLSDTGGSRYLRVRMVLEYPKNEKLAAELKEKNAQVQEDVLHVLRSKTVEDIMPLDKEALVKNEILTSINSKLDNGKVEKIYFTDFLIQ